ncbi:MAG: hypothetical protein JSR77_04345 [Planctomycetes bacterium]|nr:hypothetical protein [Planctomycetota bacterium]
MKGFAQRLFDTAAYLTDDRGQRVEVNRNARETVLGNIDRRPPNAQGPGESGLGGRTKKGMKFIARFAMAALAMLLYGILGAPAIQHTARLLGISFVEAVVCWAVFIGALAVFWPFTFGRAWDSRSRTLHAARRLVAGLCAACEYNIAQVPAAPDGCRACPECGAAWKLDEWQTEFRARTPPPLRDRKMGPFATDAAGYSLPVVAERTQPQLAARLREARRRTWTWTLFALDATIAGATILAAWLFLSDAMPAEQMVVTGVVAASWVMVLGALIAARYLEDRADRSRRIAIDLLASGLCPCCESRIAAEPGLHGWRLCPRCGGAWPTNHRVGAVVWVKANNVRTE